MKKNFYFVLVITLFSMIIIRIWNIYGNKDYYRDLLHARTNIYVYGESAPRGRILDTNGKVLVDNRLVKAIYYKKVKGITTKEEIDIALKLATLLNVNEGSILEQKRFYLITHNNGNNLITDEEYKLLKYRKLTNNDIYNLKIGRITQDMLNDDEITRKAAHIYNLMNSGYIYQKKLITNKVEEQEYALVMESNIKGVFGELTWERIYPYGDTLKGIFGSVGPIPKEDKEYYLNNGYELSDIVGLSYLEKEYEDYLKGEKALYKVDSNNDLILIKEAKKGNDLVLAIDIDVQKYVEEVLKEKILEGQKNSKAKYYKESYALVGNPNNGEIIAISGIKLNQDGSFSEVSLNNINKSWTMGSAVKGATIAVGYKYNLIDIGKKITDSCVKLYSVPQKCSHKRLGKIDDLIALQESSNYYQYLIAIKSTGNEYYNNMKLNVTDKDFKKYRDMLASFGLGVKTNIDLPKENIGIIGSKIAPDLLLNLAIGQYDTYTPIEMLQYINSIATGYRMSISLMRNITGETDIIIEHDMDVLNEIPLDSNYLSRIREGLKLVLSKGTGRFHVPQGLDFVGKTGTSESFYDSNSDGINDVATITSTFVGYYPKDNPKYSIVVITPNISYKSEDNSKMYYGASKITKKITTFLSENY